MEVQGLPYNGSDNRRAITKTLRVTGVSLFNIHVGVDTVCMFQVTQIILGIHMYINVLFNV